MITRALLLVCLLSCSDGQTVKVRQPKTTLCDNGACVTLGKIEQEPPRRKVRR